MFCGKITISVKNNYKTKLIAVLKIVYIVIKYRGRTVFSQKSDLSLTIHNK